MYNTYVILNFYPQQKESLCKIMAETVKAGFLFKKKYNKTYENAMRLKKVVQDNIQFLITSILNNESVDSVSIIAEYKMLSNVLLDSNFLWLLAKNSLTNRIIAGCEKKDLSKSVVYRIRECITAFELLNSDFCM